MKIVHCLALALVVLSSGCNRPEAGPSLSADRDADVLVVGAGISGLSAALEMARSGANVLVVDVASVFGGHAVSAHGGLSIVGSPIQDAAGVKDSPDIAYKDFITYGEDASEEWVLYYVNQSRRRIFDWVSRMGVEFEDLWFLAGNSVPRFHNIKGRGLGLVTPIYLNALEAGVRFEWNTRVEELTFEGSRVSGIKGTNQRTQDPVEFRAPIVVLATGGFQSNLEKVEEHWIADFAFPDRILAGSGWNSQGSGLDLAKQANAGFHRLDHQWNYVTGLPDPRYPNDNRGLNLLQDPAIWVNTEGVRFINECASAKDAMPALLAQPTGSYWTVFDAEAKPELVISGSGWTEEKLERLVFQNPDLVRTENTLAELAAATGMPAEALSATVAGFNRMLAARNDTDFGRIRPDDQSLLDCQKMEAIDSAPFYAVRLYPLARKSMGGIEIDLTGRVLDEQGAALDGLFAVGEVTGFGGINGKAGLEGTFLGPSILTGRSAGVTILGELKEAGVIPLETELRPLRKVNLWEAGKTASSFGNEECTQCHDLGEVLATKRQGYWHFELSHGRVIENELACSTCHSDMYPYSENQHSSAPLARARSCTQCHGLAAVD